MSKFNEIELVQAFYDQHLIPTLLHEVKPLEDPLVPTILNDPVLGSLKGEWRTSETARRKFWLTIDRGTVRLHTTKIGHWIWTTAPVLDVGKDWIEYGNPVRKERLTYRLEEKTLTISVPAPSVFQGQFRLRQDNE